MKFGGTSVSSKENIERIRSILSQKKENYIIVVSAFSGITDQLEHIAHQALKENVSDLLKTFRAAHFDKIKAFLSIADQTELLLEVQKKCNRLEAICNGVHLLRELSPRTKATILSFGEQLSVLILHKYLRVQNIALCLPDRQKLIVANGDYLKGDVDFNATRQNISEAIKEGNYIVSGFIACNQNGETVTLGRGGSDYSAAIFASTVNARSLEIWSDINGIHSSNPNMVKHTRSIKKLSYEEAFELAYFGAKILYPPSVIPARKKKIPIYLKNTFYPEQEGTVISNENQTDHENIKGLSSLNNMAIITLSGVGLAKQKGRARKVFQTLEEHHVNVTLITQSCSEQSIGIGIRQDDLKIAEEALNHAFEKEIEKGFLNAVKITKDQCIIALVGDNMKHKVGLCGKVFGAIGENGINVTAIAQGASERNISIVISQKEEIKAMNVIHEKFFSGSVKTVHLFIAGVGNVGSEFLNIVEDQREKMISEFQLNLKIVGIANSKRYLIDEANGLSLQAISALNENGKVYDSFSQFLDIISTLNLRNSVFVDNTASEAVSRAYAHLFKQSISVVTCNKIACSSDYEYYALLNKLAREHHCHFRYETSVGAALPIIKTIHDLIISGDKIHKIEAVISGSLNYIFNEYNHEKMFSDVVLQAKKEGYTEPNPLVDLSGLDVMRKILILSREAGYKKELADIRFNCFLPGNCARAKSGEALLEELKKNEQHFKSLYTQAHQKRNKLKVVASMETGKMSAGLKEIPANSPFYNLEGKDNVVAINTGRYATEPLVIKGAGAGANVTASGVFADLMFIINR